MLQSVVVMKVKKLMNKNLEIAFKESIVVISSDSFPMNAEVFIADMDLFDETLTNLIIKEAGKKPDIVIGHNVFVRKI